MKGTIAKQPPSVLFNCCTDERAPDWRQFDAIEVNGVRNVNAADDPEGTMFEACDDSVAELWTVYGHFDEKTKDADGRRSYGVTAITDAPTRADAEAIAEYFRTLIPAPWVRVIFAADVDDDSSECPGCGGDYGECPCPGPTMDDYEYTEDEQGVMWGRLERAKPKRKARS